MKARVKASGEVIDVEPFLSEGRTMYRPNNSLNTLKTNELEFIPNGVTRSGYLHTVIPEEIESRLTIAKEIDWEQRRYEVAKGIMLCVSTRGLVGGNAINTNVALVVKYAEALIEELKK